MNAQEALLCWLERRLEPADLSWLRECCLKLAAGVPDRLLSLTFSQAVRHAGKRPLAANPVEQGEAFSIHPGWDLNDWTCDQAARAAILLSIPSGSGAVAAILALHQAADLGEHLAMVRCLFLLPDAKGLLHIAREAIRSNMRDIFAAISQRNPFPAEHCDEIAWNQMVVKCLFVDLPLRFIFGLDRRANKELRRILVDLWLERTAARRPFSSEAWRCVGPFADEKAMSAMETALNGPLPERHGAALGLWSAPEEKGRAVLKVKTPELVGALQTGILNWENYDA